ncbi:MAG: pyridoxal phosphate-dependent class II aminotransferase [Syntrophomonadaceae bacterium]|nr:pyridoxal phosphate-dependent class II aminotransferase [Syntrophomonadaceae bacterium]
MINTQGKPVHGGNVWAASEKWSIAPEKFLDYSANINPLGPSPEGNKAIQRSLGLLTHYPEPTGEKLKMTLGRYLHINPENLVLGNGGSELIYLMGRMFCQKRVLVLAPTFSEYGEGIEEPEVYEIYLEAQEQFQLPTREIIEQMQAGDLIFLGNPNNPTGNLFSREELSKIVKQAEIIKAVVVLDEAFVDFVGDDSSSLRDLAVNSAYLIVIGSLTKFFAIPALRLGYAVATAENIMRMERLLPTWRINTLAQAAALASINHQEFIDNSIQLIREERPFLSAGLKQIKGLKVYDSATNFILIDGEGAGVTSEELQERLGPEGVLIRKCNSFNNLSPYYFRLGVKTRKENQRLLDILRKVLD